MDEDLQKLRRSMLAGEIGAAAKLDAWLDRLEGRQPGAVRRLFDPRTGEPVAFLIDASQGPVHFTLPSKRPGMFDPIWAKKMDPSSNPMLIVAPEGTTFENGERVWYQPVVTQYQSVGPFVLHGTTWVVI